MSTQTSNLGLNKPDISDTPGVTIPQLASNFDKIDGSLADIAMNVVRKYGADPTGVNDSTTAIQNALNSLISIGGTVFFPEGTYKTSSPLQVPSSVKLQFASHTTTIKFVGTGDAIQIFNQKHVYMELGNIDISGAGPNSNGIHIAGLWYGTFISPRVVKGPTNSVGIKIETSATGGNDWGAYIIRIQDFECSGTGAYDIQSFQTTGDTVSVTHLSINGGWTNGGASGIYLQHVQTGYISGITPEGGDTTAGSAIYIGAGCSDIAIVAPGEMDGYKHGITADGCSNLFVFGNNTNGNVSDINILNNATVIRHDNGVMRLNAANGYSVEVQSVNNYNGSFNVNVNGGGGNGGNILSWSDGGGLHIWSGGSNVPLSMDSPVNFNQHAITGFAWQSGATGSRPSNPVVGQVYYDTTLSKPIWCKVGGATPTWTDATGATV